jgi:hypothetical protein
MRCCWGSVSIFVVPPSAQLRTGAGTHNHECPCCAKLAPRLCLQHASVVMGPGSRSLRSLVRATRLIRFSNSQFRDRHCEPTGRADARPMTGEAIQKPSFRDGPKDQTSDAQLRIVVRCFASPRNDESGLLRRFRLRSWSDGGQVAPRHDGKIRCSPPLTTVVRASDSRGRRECRVPNAPAASRAM